MINIKRRRYLQRDFIISSSYGVCPLLRQPISPTTRTSDNFIQTRCTSHISDKIILRWCSSQSSDKSTSPTTLFSDNSFYIRISDKIYPFLRQLIFARISDKIHPLLRQLIFARISDKIYPFLRQLISPLSPTKYNRYSGH